jgi:hypothetical protein
MKEKPEDEIQQNLISACFLAPESSIVMPLYVFVACAWTQGHYLYDIVHDTVHRALKGIRCAGLIKLTVG